MIVPGTFLRQARVAAGITQAELAERLETTQSAIARLEAPGANPQFETFRRALAATGNSLEVSLTPSTWPPFDETMPIRNLRMSPAERLAYFTASYQSIRKLSPTYREKHGSERQKTG